MRVGPLINAQFAAFSGGRHLSGVDDFTFDTSVVLWVATVLMDGAQRSPLAVSGVLLASSVPAVVLALVAGVFSAAGLLITAGSILAMRSLRSAPDYVSETAAVDTV